MADYDSTERRDTPNTDHLARNSFKILVLLLMVTTCNGIIIIKQYSPNPQFCADCSINRVTLVRSCTCSGVTFSTDVSNMLMAPFFHKADLICNNNDCDLRSYCSGIAMKYNYRGTTPNIYWANATTQMALSDSTLCNWPGTNGFECKLVSECLMAILYEPLLTIDRAVTTTILGYHYYAGYSSFQTTDGDIYINNALALPRNYIGRWCFDKKGKDGSDWYTSPSSRSCSVHPTGKEVIPLYLPNIAKALSIGDLEIRDELPISTKLTVTEISDIEQLENYFKEVYQERKVIELASQVVRDNAISLTAPKVEEYLKNLTMVPTTTKLDPFYRFVRGISNPSNAYTQEDIDYLLNLAKVKEVQKSYSIITVVGMATACVLLILFVSGLALYCVCRNRQQPEEEPPNKF